MPSATRLILSDHRREFGIRRLLGLILASTVAIFALPALTAAVPVASLSMSYTHAGSSYGVPGDDVVLQRGPSPENLAGTTDDPVGRRLHGTSARPEARPPPSITTYAYPAPPMEVAGDTTTAGTQVGAPGGDLSSLQRSVGAAKSGSDLIRARDVRFTQDSVGSSFRTEESVLDAAEDWARAGKAPSWMDSNPNRIFEENGTIYSLDNRRLLAGQYADVSLPFRRATPAEIARRDRSEIFGGTSTMVRFTRDKSNWAWWQR